MDSMEHSLPDIKETYNIRVKRIKGCSTIGTELMEQRIGGIFFKRGAKADLKNPGFNSDFF